MNRPNAIAFVVTDLVRAGAENQVVELAIRFRQRGFRVALVSLIPPQAHVSRLVDNGIHLVDLGMRRGRPDLRAIFRLRKFLKQWGAEIVHSHMVHANLLTRITHLVLRMPVLVCTAHSLYEGGRFREQLYRYTDPLCDLTTHVSRTAIQRYLDIRAISKAKAKFVPNGVDTDYFSPDAEVRRATRLVQSVDEGQFVWLAAGRLAPEKDFQTLLRAHAISLTSRPSVLWLAGKGELEQELQELAVQLGTSDFVRFLGLREDMPALLNAADGFVLSSKWEGMPLALLEAGAVGKLSVATDVGGVSEVVMNGVSGYLVPPNDTHRLGTEMIRVVAQTEDERRKMGNDARAWIQENFGFEVVIDQWERVYNALWSRTRGAVQVMQGMRDGAKNHHPSGGTSDVH